MIEVNMKIYEAEGDPDLMRVNCVDRGEGLLLQHAVDDNDSTTRLAAVKLEWGSRFEKSERMPIDCPQAPTYGSMMLSDRAIAVLEQYLTHPGYLVDTVIDAQLSYKIWICRTELCILDEENSELTRFTDGGVWKISRHEFLPCDFKGVGVFQIKGRRSHLFVTDAFVDTVKEYKLTGFIFTEIWSNDSGGVQLTLPTLPLESFPGEFTKRAERKRKAFREGVTKEKT